MLMPGKVKFRKQQRGRRSGKAMTGSTVAFGDFGLKTLEDGWITAREIEASRVAITRFVKRGGKIWVRIFPDKPITKKPAETRMGKGKGAPEAWVAVVKPGKVLFEMEGVEEKVAREAMRLAAHKLPVKTKFVARQAQEGGDDGGAKEDAQEVPRDGPRPPGQGGRGSPDRDLEAQGPEGDGADRGRKQAGIGKRDLARLMTVRTERRTETSAGKRS